MAALDRTVVTNSEAPKPLEAYSLGMSVSPGKLVYVAGQVGVDFDGNIYAGEVTRARLVRYVPFRPPEIR